MAGTLSPTRSEVSPRHSVLGFTVRTGIAGPSWFEVVMVADPGLIESAARSQRMLNTFARSGLQYAERVVICDSRRFDTLLAIPL